MNALLPKLSDIEDLDVQVKEWRNEIGELSYDIKDCIDNFMHRVDRSFNSSVMKCFFRKVIHQVSDCTDARPCEVEVREAAVRNATSVLPNNLQIKIERHWAGQMVKDKMGSTDDDDEQNSGSGDGEARAGGRWRAEELGKEPVPSGGGSDGAGSD
ncbi:hypothetical protein E2562_019620 [Oryza meyeriana var. granulata]|uniref:Disease resistance N-terminal domain-containing protein n=1 Tax=Oryza meyeriana var. granulata TaxID=110450 RepID=A0A6G1C7F6_9ORYZ|nr:hypothetical protein E2562_019620 [Oryza meyeriana var. granulata]